jgi:hypothetical protein
MAGYIGLERTVGTSAANTAQTVSVGGGALGANDGVARRVKYITVHYSASPTQTGVTLTLNSGAGSTYDTLLKTGTADAQNNFYSELDFGRIILMGDDTLDIVAPAAGGAITSRVTAICEGYYGPD